MKTLKLKLPQFSKNTHKGEHGCILIVGGSNQYYGAPILTALGAQSAGADLITLHIPKEHLEAAKHYSLNFFLKHFAESHLTSHDVSQILESAESNHVLAIGNGLGKDFHTHHAILEILEKIKIPVVLDAEALFPEIFKLKTSKKNWILTPHHKEFERVCGVKFSVENLKHQSKKHGCVFLVKGPTDYIGYNGHVYENHTGCVQMRVGGTGDVLAGIVASYYAQGLKPIEAVYSAAYYYGKAGEHLAHEQNTFSAHELSQFYNKSTMLKNQNELV